VNASSPDETGPLELLCRRATEPAAGWRDPASGFWAGDADAVLVRDQFGHTAPEMRTQVRARWCTEHFYFLFQCDFQELHLNPSPRLDSETNELWNWDVAEVFIGAGGAGLRRYREFEVSPLGEWVDLDIDLDSPHHEDGWTWASGMEAAASIDAPAKVWYAAMRIPYSSIGSSSAAGSQIAAPGSVLRINLFRTEGPSHRGVAWRPTGQETFHVPESFGLLRLVD
jgi:hypothetical protein